MRAPEAGDGREVDRVLRIRRVLPPGLETFLTVSAPADARLLVVVLRVSLLLSRRADKGLPDRLLPLMPLFHPPRAHFDTHGDTGQLTERGRPDF
jgi:hypothetical protein